MNTDNSFKGFLDLQKELADYVKNVEKPLEILEVGANSFVKDLLKLPKPKSDIIKSGYTHLITTFSYNKTSEDIEIGWGKYYGRMVEEGTKKTKKQSHLKPLFEKNKEKYYQQMIKKFKEK